MEDPSAREGGRQPNRFWITTNINGIVTTIARFAGSEIYFTRFPGACAPGFMLTPAPQADQISHCLTTRRSNSASSSRWVWFTP
jgi:hypothetical protein